MLTAADALRILQGKVTEEQVMQAILEALRAHGYIALSTVHRVHVATCPKCAARFRAAGGYGADFGISDILARRDDMGTGHWLGLEVKKPGGALSPAQQDLERRGAILIVRSPQEALEAMRR